MSYCGLRKGSRIVPFLSLSVLESLSEPLVHHSESHYVTSKDINASRGFYTELLGLTVAMDTTNRSGDCGCDLIDVLSNTRPLGAAGESDEGNAARTQVLLVADAPIGGGLMVDNRW